MSLATRLAILRGNCALGLAVALTLAAAPALGSASPAAPARPAAPAPRAATPPAQPAPAQPQAPAPQAGAGPAIVQVKADPGQADWMKVCGKDPNNLEICYTARDFVSDNGQPILSLAVYDVKAQQPQRIVRFILPIALLLQPGIRVAVDQGQPVPGRFSICMPNGCFAEIPASADFLNALKRGTTLNVSAQNAGGREATFAIPLAGFSKAFDSAGLDAKAVEEQQRKLQEELEKKSDELRRRLEQQTAPGAAAPAPAAPAPAARPATPPAR